MKDERRTHTLPLDGDLLGGRFRLLGRLGQGGMATVYKARHKLLDQDVAIKFLRPELFEGDDGVGAEVEQRFMREARLATRLIHPHVVTVREFGASDDHGLYLVMDFCAGRTLRAIMKEEAPFSVGRSVGLIRQLLAGVGEAHRLGVLHRDLKPENVIVDDDGHLQVLDFGVAALIDTSEEAGRLTSQGVILGTPLYMSPEQAQNRSVDARSDVYAVGTMLYELLAGRLPHDSRNPLSLLALRISHPPLSLAEATEQTLPAGLADVVMRAIALDPDARWPSAAQLHAALAPYEDSDVSALAPHGGDVSALHDTMQAEPIPTPMTRTAQTGLMVPTGQTTQPTQPTAPQPAAGGRRTTVAAVVALLVALGGAVFWWMSRDAVPPVAELQRTAVDTFGRLMPAEVPQTPTETAKVKLGATLYHDRRLSPDASVSCNDCHPLARFGADGARLSRGPGGRMTTRNTPTIYGTAMHTLQGWVGHSRGIDEQCAVALTSDHANGLADDAAVAAALRGIPAYAQPFAAAFPDDADPLTARRAGEALGAYVRQLVPRAAFDDFLDGDLDALTESELTGLHTFIALGCTTCHVDPAIGGSKMQKLGLIHPYPTADLGRYTVTRQPQHRNVFKVPTLRNVTQTGPWLHDGSMSRLEDVVELMAWHQLGERATARQVDAIVAFLHALESTPDPALIAAPSRP